MLIVKHGSISDLMDELHTEVVALGKHLFQADWQLDQFRGMKTRIIPKSTVAMVMDFAENFSCVFQVGNSKSLSVETHFPYLLKYA